MWTCTLIFVCLSVCRSKFLFHADVVALTSLAAYSVLFVFSILSTYFANLYSYRCSRYMAIFLFHKYIYLLFFVFPLLTFGFVGYICLYANCSAHKFIRTHSNNRRANTLLLQNNITLYARGRCFHAVIQFVPDFIRFFPFWIVKHIYSIERHVYNTSIYSFSMYRN